MTTIEMLPGTTRETARAGGYRLGLAALRSEVLAVCRLRDLVFGLEGGARTPGPDGLDIDAFDEICDHLVVWYAPDEFTPEVPVATYRLLPPSAVGTRPRALGLYSATEFDLAPLEGLLPLTVEAGRACVHPDHRTATAISLLWRGIARYLQAAGHRYLLGCASVPVADGGRIAAGFADLVERSHRAPAELRCRPHRPFPLAPDSAQPAVRRSEIPPLLLGYLRLGAVICSDPAWDVDFGTADSLLLLDLHRSNQRYLQHFLAGPAR